MRQDATRENSSVKSSAIPAATSQVQCCNVGQDLCAREARCHESCRRDYVRQDKRQHHSAAQGAEGEGAKETKPAHAACFEHSVTTFKLI